MNPDEELLKLREQVASLTQRVWKLEQRLGAVEPASEQPPTVEAQAQPSTVREPIPPHPTGPPLLRPLPPRSFGMQSATREGLEERIGSQWLNRVGIVAVLIGVSYFLKLAIDNNWIGPATRVVIGIVAGIAMLVWSERFRHRGFQAFSYSLKAIGIGVLYLSLWASSQAYQLIPNGLAFTGMVAVTAAMAWMAIRQRAEILAGMALVGGFLTPVLLSTGENRQAALFSYVVLLDLGALVLQRFHKWPRLLLGAFVGTFMLYVAWYNSYFTQDQYGSTMFFISVFFLIFFAAPLITSAEDRQTQAALVLLPVLNCTVFFLEARAAMIGPATDSRSAAYALGIAILCFGMAQALRRRESEVGIAELSAPVVHEALAAAFLAIAIGLRFSARWITLGWIVEAAGLFYAGVQKRRESLKLFAVATMCLAIVRLLFVDIFAWYELRLLFNERFGMFLLAMVAVGWMVWLQLRQGLSESIRPVVAVAIIAINLLGLVALNLEVRDQFAQRTVTVREQERSRAPQEFSRALRTLDTERDFSYSAVWMAYGAGLMALGFWRKSQFLRWQAIVLIGLTVLKVFVYDVSALDRVYRIASFIILGVILLAVSFVYQKRLATQS